MIFYFSGTGNSKWIADQLAVSLHEELIAIPFAVRNKLYTYAFKQKEKVGFVFPVYSWGPPSIVLDFIHDIKTFSNPGYLFFVCSCGDDTGLTEQVFKKHIARKGWECSAGFSVCMPNNYVLLPGFDVDAEPVKTSKLFSSVKRIEYVTDCLKQQQYLFDCHEGSMAFVKTRIIRPLFNKYQMTPRSFRVTENCVSCGRCVKHCPMENITLSNGHPVWGDQCVSCLACYHICPVNAVQYGKRTINKGQYFFGKK